MPTKSQLPPCPPQISRPSYGSAEVVNAIESEMQSIVEQRAERHPLTAIKYRAIRKRVQGGNCPPPYFRKNKHVLIYDLLFLLALKFCPLPLYFKTIQRP